MGSSLPIRSRGLTPHFRPGEVRSEAHSDSPGSYCQPEPTEVSSPPARSSQAGRHPATAPHLKNRIFTNLVLPPNSFLLFLSFLCLVAVSGSEVFWVKAAFSDDAQGLWFTGETSWSLLRLVNSQKFNPARERGPPWLSGCPWQWCWGRWRWGRQAARFSVCSVSIVAF